MADDSNNITARWWSLAQTLVWIIQRIEMLPRAAEQIANSPEMALKIEWALNELKREFYKAVLGVTKGMPIDKFRIKCDRHYVDLLSLISLPWSAEPGALSAAIEELQQTIRWPDVECNSDWLKRVFPAPAPAAETSASVVNTESSVTAAPPPASDVLERDTEKTAAVNASTPEAERASTPNTETIPTAGSGPVNVGWVDPTIAHAIRQAFPPKPASGPPGSLAREPEESPNAPEQPKTPSPAPAQATSEPRPASDAALRKAIGEVPKEWWSRGVQRQRDGSGSSSWQEVLCRAIGCAPS